MPQGPPTLWTARKGPVSDGRAPAPAAGSHVMVESLIRRRQAAKLGDKPGGDAAGRRRPRRLDRLSRPSRTRLTGALRLSWPCFTRGAGVS